MYGVIMVNVQVGGYCSDIHGVESLSILIMSLFENQNVSWNLQDVYLKS